jgi:thiol-disulfide isomerase/thioredoxin
MVPRAPFLVLAALGVLSQFLPIRAQDNPKQDAPREAKPAPSLKVGDPAPALKVTRWLQGEAVRKFEPGKVYVVEFWAISCGALHAFMPQLAELQNRYKHKGVTVIAITCRGIRGWTGNTEKEVAAFVKKQRPPLSYSFAYGDDGTTADAWLNAAGHKGFCTFVVDKAGRIAYMGHPMFLNLVLTKVVAGRASAKSVGTEMARVVAEYETTHDTLVRHYKAGNPKAGLRAVKQFEAKYPPLTDLLTMVRAKLSLLPKHGNPGEGKAYAQAVITRAIKQNDVAVLELAYSILRHETESKELLALAVQAAEARVRIDGGGGAQSLLNVAGAHRAGGDKARAKEYARRAIDAARGEPSDFQQSIEKEARRLGAEK